MTRLPAIRALLRHSRASRADILAYQNAQLRALVQHAHARVPYYRSLFDRHGIQPRHIRSVADMPIIPITTKADLQLCSPAELVSEGVDPAGLLQRRTSGSSGLPFTVRRTRVEEHLLGAFRLRALHQYGLRPRDHAVAVILHPLAEHARLDLAQRLSRLTGLYRRTIVNVLMEPPEIIRELRHLRPDMLAGYPGGLSNVATVLDEADRQAIRPRFVTAGAEVLTPVIRRQIATGFRAPVFDVYGSHEFNLLAWECTVTGQLHVCDDALILEVLQDHHSVAVGERGEVVGTNLHAFAMPFIRFRLGDVVTRGVDACPCGQPFSVISSVHGRMLDYFPLPDGRLLHPYHITAAAVRDASWMRQYRLIQERVDRIVMHIVPASEPTVGELAALHDRVRTLLPPSVVFVVDLVPKIELEANGKFRTSRSLVSSSYDGIAWDRIDDRPSPIGPPGS